MKDAETFVSASFTSEMLTLPSQSPKKFYLLDYFYVLLLSVAKYSRKPAVFEDFKVLKHKHNLGESKYKTLTAEPNEISKLKEDRYRYTFEGVIQEAKDYGLIEEDGDNLFLTKEGQDLLNIYQSNGVLSFNQTLFKLMEKKNYDFRKLVEFLYNSNSVKGGLLVLPFYSPRLLHIEKAAIKNTKNVLYYLDKLCDKFSSDIASHLGKPLSLDKGKEQLVKNLVGSGIIQSEEESTFDPKDYNTIILRVRHYWLNYFLKELYGYEGSMSTFERWTRRGKQVGIVHVTEFYPNFAGQIVYPTSVVSPTSIATDFEELFSYPDGKHFFVHKPQWEENQNIFIKHLVDAYFDLRRSNYSYFISLPSLRELVCYTMRISEFVFEDFLNQAYRLNLAGMLQVRISLEGDKNPEETKAMYLTKEPIMVEGRYRNIIAIDVTKGEKLK